MGLARGESSALQRFPNMVGLGSSAEVLRAVLKRQREWHSSIATFAETGTLPKVSELKQEGGAMAEQTDCLEMYLMTGQQAAHTEVLTNPRCLRALSGILLLKAPEDEPEGCSVSDESSKGMGCGLPKGSVGGRIAGGGGGKKE